MLHKVDAVIVGVLPTTKRRGGEVLPAATGGLVGLLLNSQTLSSPWSPTDRPADYRPSGETYTAPVHLIFDISD